MPQFVRNKGPGKNIDDLEIAFAEYINRFNYRRHLGDSDGADGDSCVRRGTGRHAPYLAPQGLGYWILMVVGMMWQLVVSIAILRRELGGLHWPAVKERIWFTGLATRAPASHGPSGGGGRRP